MKHGKLERKLLAVAKANPPSDAVPYAFERRIMARLGTNPVLDAWAGWASALWRAAAPCVAIALVLGVWAAFDPGASSTSTDFEQELEDTVLVAVTQDSNSNW
jgi:hypothetical protein